MKIKSKPRFLVDKKSKPPRVFIQCSQCSTDIREMLPGERVKVTQAYYCDSCDPGATVLNLPRKGDRE